MDATLIICLAQLTAVAGREGAKNYLKHRKKMIHEGRADELLSNQLKKSAGKLRMSSPLTRPTLQRQKRISFNEKVLNTVVDAVQPKSEIIDQLQEDLIPPLAEKIDDLYVKSSKSIRGNMVDFIRSVTPTRRQTVTEDTTNPEFKRFVSDIMLFVYQQHEIEKTDPNSLLLKHKNYYQLLIRHLDEVAKKKRETDA